MNIAQRVIDTIAFDFRKLDVWALPVEGDRTDFPRFLETIEAFDPAAGPFSLTHVLFWIRRRAGALLHWDDVKRREIPGTTETSLRDRLPDALRPNAGSTAFNSAGFTRLYRTDVEAAAEISNETVHGVLHFGWVEQGNGRYRAEMTVYVKPRGRLGEIYMKIIQPFRHLVVYPTLIREIGRAWEQAQPERSRAAQ